MVYGDMTIFSCSPGCSLRFIGSISKLDGPHPQLFLDRWYDCSPLKGAALPCQFAEIVRIRHGFLRINPKAETPEKSRMVPARL